VNNAPHAVATPTPKSQRKRTAVHESGDEGDDGEGDDGATPRKRRATAKDSGDKGSKVGAHWVWR
jgi:hypothetical protein